MRADMDEKNGAEVSRGRQASQRDRRLAADHADKGGSVSRRSGKRWQKLELSPGLRPAPFVSPLFIWLQRKVPGAVEDGSVRTLQASIFASAPWP